MASTDRPDGGELRAPVRQQETVAELGRRALETDDLEAFVEAAASAVTDVLEADCCTLFEARGDELVLREGVGVADDLVGSATVPADRDSQVGYALLTTEPVVVGDLEADSRFLSDRLAGRDVTSGITVVVGPTENPWGVFGIYTTDRRSFADHDVTFVRNVGNVLSSAIENERVKRRLHEERTLNERIVETSPIGITIVGRDGELQFANDRAEEIFGRERAWINELSFDDPDWDEIGVDGEPLEREDLPFPRIIESGEPLYDQVSGVLRPDGERVWISVNGAPLRDERGEIEGVVFAIEDVTERKEIERELHKSERKFRQLAENLEQVVWMSTPEKDEMLYVNPAYEEVWDRSREQLYENPDAFLEAIHPDDRDRVRASLDGQKGGEYDEEYRVVRPDGTVRWVRDRATPVYEDGAVDRIVGIANDVTERKRRERTLEESEQRYRTLLEHFPNGAVALFDESLEYTIAGGELLDELGIESEEIIGESVDERYPEELVSRIEPKFRGALAGEEHSVEIEYYDRDLLVYTLPVRNSSGNIFAGMLMAQDVTERKEARRKLEELVDELEASNEQLEQFAYAVSHDLQEPLRMVSSYLTLLERRYTDELDDDAREFIGFAVDGADRMQAMIDGLLEYSRIDTRGDPFEPVELDAVLEEVLADLEVRIEESNADVTVESLPRVYGDRSQLRQAFQNLIANAIEYSGERPPRVAVTAERADEGESETWRVSVEDDGIGIEPENADRIFEVFNRLHSQDEHPGTGIGLTLCRRIVDRHGGEIDVESEPGEGSTFTVSLPAVPPNTDHE
ncbi:PAS domain S-box protein [Natrialbaceae archaeon AArc-T1-2]|uniref:PAS domain S-box protein n=1 Tax=Natrialbaceae archaeon AArc-T1-2 TaxID=3053904 RepID=UPI00255AC0CD|nr:PAS domain S-box protein [Natrialbaceae archaeon AArc-T1-2]WIV66525.1 PAS domain S-box protein [Natrialbaceae archaeon AArc-T1-2]